MKNAERTKAKVMRSRGFSLGEISEALKVSKGTVSVWVRGILLNKIAKKRLRKLTEHARLKAARTNRAKTVLKEGVARSEALKTLADIHEDRSVARLIASMLYWCEGSKLYNGHGYFSFTNSDPTLIGTFLRVLRKGFVIDESKFRVCLHLHSYHSESEQLKFWSKLTNIPTEQFIRSYRKTESGVTIREGYQGCVSIRYHDVTLLRQVLALAAEFLKKGP